MSIDEVIMRRNELNHALNIALATMEKKDTIQELKKEILENQKTCPHISSKYNWAIVNGICPYCGKKIYNKECSE